MLKQLVVVLLLLTFSLAMCAQQAGILRGVVTDESGALVPGAKVVVSNAAGPVKSVTSSNDGNYSIAGIAPGKYPSRRRRRAWCNFNRPTSRSMAARPRRP